MRIIWQLMMVVLALACMDKMVASAAVTNGQVVSNTTSKSTKVGKDVKTNAVRKVVKARPVARAKTWTLDAGSPLAAEVGAVLAKTGIKAWEFSGGDPKAPQSSVLVATDTLAGTPALICSSNKPVTLKTIEPQDMAGKIITAIFGLNPGESGVLGSVALNMGSTTNKGGVYGVSISGKPDSVTVSGLGQRRSFNLRPYSLIMPAWDDNMRIPLVYDMAQMPSAANRLFKVRMACDGGAFHLWVDDRYIGSQTASAEEMRGELKVTLGAGCRLIDLAIVPDGKMWSGVFLPLALDGYAYDRALIGGKALKDDALPFGKDGAFGGVPFVFANRRASTAPDHIDVGRSSFRQANLDGHMEFHTVRGGNSGIFDPGRIQLAVPFAYYDALYILAGFDGERDSIPLVSATFFRPGAGFHQIFEQTVPGLADTQSTNAVAVPVTLEDGRKLNLWVVKIPIDPARLTSFSDLRLVELEISKKMQLYRSYPDPIGYGWHAGGLPSGVHIYALTLCRAPLTMSLEPEVFGHVWTKPEVPGYNVTLAAMDGKAHKVTLNWTAKSHDGQEISTGTKSVTVDANAPAKVDFKVPVKKNGLHELAVSLKGAGLPAWTETRYFARLAENTRTATWEPGQGPFFGFWSYYGAHYTPARDEIMKVMNAAGGRHPGGTVADCRNVPSPAWAKVEKPAPEDITTFTNLLAQTILKRNAKRIDNLEYLPFWAEPAITRDLTFGHPPDYWGEAGYTLSDNDRKSLLMYYNAARYGAEFMRKAYPKTKLLIPWGDVGFIIPILRHGYPKDLIDGCGLDMIGFERLPEQQIHQMSTHRLYILREEFKKIGKPDAELVYLEGIFSPTEPGSLTWDEQAERYHRWTLISLAYGVTRFYSGWFAFDCGNYYGAEHYGGCGIQRRIPYCDPKPAYAHFATMTRMLDQAKFDGWVPTGSHSVYCLRFKANNGALVYALWTLCGTRPVELALGKSGRVTLTDAMDNDEELKPADGKVKFNLGTTPVYFRGAVIEGVALGEPDHSNAVAWLRGREQETFQTGPAKLDPPVAFEKTIADLGDGTWQISAKSNALYAQNNYDTSRYHGKMSIWTTNDQDKSGQFLAVHLEQQEKERKLMPWYTVLQPGKPVVVPGRASALGLWVKAHSDWGRVVYYLKDAKGEKWLNVGTKDQWNCDDPYSFAAFNFDGWRYLRFDLPGHLPYDNYRTAGTTWWGHYGGDGVVDLPVTLDSIIVERRTHVMYVNDVQPANSADVLLGQLVAEYASPGDDTEEAIRVSKIRREVPKGNFEKNNPIKRFADTGVLPPTTIEKITLPDWDNDGTKCFVHFKAMPDIAAYQAWIAVDPDGFGAVKMADLRKSGGQVNGFRPDRKFYLWIVYSDAQPGKKGKPAKDVQFSKPSNRFEIQLIDAFGMK